MPDKTEMSITHSRRLDKNKYSVVIAAHSDVGGPYVDLDKLSTDRYMRNPVVLWQHDRMGGPVAKTTAIKRRADGRIEAEFEFLDDDERADKVRNAWEKGFLNAASITWQPGPPPELLEWSIVAVPADPDAVRSAHIRMLDEMLLSERQMNDNDTKRLTSDEIEKIISDKLDALADSLEKRIARAFVEREAPKPVEPPVEENDEDIEEKVNTLANQRAALIAQTRELVPEGLDIDKMSNREIRLAAIGSELPDAESRSDDYLTASLDQIVQRRQEAAESRSGQGAQQAPLQYSRMGVGEMLKMRNRRRREGKE